MVRLSLSLSVLYLQSCTPCNVVPAVDVPLAFSPGPSTTTKAVQRSESSRLKLETVRLQPALPLSLTPNERASHSCPAQTAALAPVALAGSPSGAFRLIRALGLREKEAAEC